MAMFLLLIFSRDVEMPALDWDGHNKISHNIRLKSNWFILNHKLSEDVEQSALQPPVKEGGN